MNAIEVRNVSKKYAKNYKSAFNLLKYDLLNSFLKRNLKDLTCNKNEFLVLKDISFNVKEGERVAILGHNGAGKSTLLKMLYGIILPDKGEIRINGEVGGILELGGGLKKVLSGRENIKLIASYYNKSEDETQKIIDEVIEFTELGDFIDSPVNFYSSGMKAKLSFALYLYMNPDILILDEVFAAGDKKFKEKAKKKMFDLIYNTTTILVSHNTSIVKEVAQRVIVLKKGKKIFDGSVEEGIKIYKDMK
jgi:ABC-type polysaccharide/polyol phosphate transport system ATPase subunit